MKPKEFWDSTFNEINIYCQANLAKITDEYKKNISLQEAVTDKIINSNPFLFKNPKISRLLEQYAELFDKKEEEQTIEEQIKIMRG